MTEPDSASPEAPRRSRLPRIRKRRIAAGLGVLAAVAAIIAYWHYSGRETTDNARIEGHVHPVASRVSGTVLRVLVRENDPVEEGQLLAELDPRDFQVALDQAEADLAAAEAAALAARSALPVATTGADARLDAAHAGDERARVGVDLAARQVRVAEQQLDAASAGARAAESEVERTRLDVERLAPLAAADQVPRKLYDDSRSAFAGAVAALDAQQARVGAARDGIAIARAGLAQAQSDVARSASQLTEAKTAPEQKANANAEAATIEARALQARARRERARLDLEYSEVRAPAAGIVSKKSVEVGQVVRAGQPLLAVVALGEVWTVANFKETQIDRMVPGQPARLRIDAYPGYVRSGRVESLGAATGSRFSMLPADNATGNFVKVVQRIPVKIAFDGPNDPERPLRPGMSVIAIVLQREPAPAPSPAPP